MNIGTIDGATRIFTKPDGWNDENGECGDLSVQDVETPAGNVMVSAWIPTPDEVRLIAAGQPVYLWVYGTTMPPVGISVAGSVQ